MFDQPADLIRDGALVVRVANGDVAAANELIGLLAPKLLNHAKRVLGNQHDAEDAVQETFVRLWKVAPVWRQGEARVYTWCYRVLVNLCTDRLRARRPSVDIDAIAEPASDMVSAVEEMTERQRAVALEDALSMLPDRQRQAVILRHLEQMSNPEIAEIMDMSVEAVESLTARGKRNLKAALQGRRAELGYEDDG